MSEHKKILIVDAEKDSRELLHEILTAGGYLVFLAADGEEGLRMSDEVIPDLVISDILMPKMGGSEFYKEIRRRHYGKNIPFLVLSARPQMRDYFDALGVTDFIGKPVVKDVSLSKVQTAFAQLGPEIKREKHKRVLVVARYEKECIEGMTEQMKQDGCHTDFVTMGEQAVSKAVMFLPEVIIVESRMFDMSPSSIVRILRQMPQFKKTPILIFNFYHKSELKGAEDLNLREMNLQYFVKECLEAGATKYIGPYTKETFRDKIKKYLTEGTILLIDDDEGIVRLLKKALEGEGYSVFAARDADQGLGLARDINPSLIVLDVVMPGKNGFEALEELKATPSIKDIPVVMLTVQGGDSEIQRGLKMGVEDYITKPINTNLFLKRINTILKAH